MCIFRREALAKVILHSIRYGTCPVNGVLLEDPSQSSSYGSTFVDAIPLFHGALNLSAPMEVAFEQIEVLCREKGLQIGAYYFANERTGDTTISPTHDCIARKIAERRPRALLFMVDNKEVASGMKNIPLLLFSRKDAKWVHSEDEQILIAFEGQETSEWNSLIHEDISRLLEDRRQFDVVDFQRYLDNVRLDWRNPGLP